MDADNTIDINRELLSAYLDDALTEADRARVEILLRTSDSLRRELAEMVRVRNYLPPGLHLHPTVFLCGV